MVKLEMPYLSEFSDDKEKSMGPRRASSDERLGGGGKTSGKSGEEKKRDFQC